MKWEQPDGYTVFPARPIDPAGRHLDETRSVRCQEATCTAVVCCVFTAVRLVVHDSAAQVLQHQGGQ